MKLKNQLMNQAHLGTYQGDKFIEDAESDPNINLTGGNGNNSGNEESPSATYGQSKLSQLFQIM